MSRDNSSTYNLVAIVFVGLTVFVCLCALLLMLNRNLVPGPLRPKTPIVITPASIPTDTITPSPTNTPTPTETFTPTNTPIPTRTPRPTNTPG